MSRPAGAGKKSGQMAANLAHAGKYPAKTDQNLPGPIRTKVGRWRKSLSGLPPYCQGSYAGEPVSFNTRAWG